MTSPSRVDALDADVVHARAAVHASSGRLVFEKTSRSPPRCARAQARRQLCERAALGERRARLVAQDAEARSRRRASIAGPSPARRRSRTRGSRGRRSCARAASRGRRRSRRPPRRCSARPRPRARVDHVRDHARASSAWSAPRAAASASARATSARSASACSASSRSVELDVHDRLARSARPARCRCAATEPSAPRSMPKTGCSSGGPCSPAPRSPRGRCRPGTASRAVFASSTVEPSGRRRPARRRRRAARRRSESRLADLPNSCSGGTPSSSSRGARRSSPRDERLERIVLGRAGLLREQAHDLVGNGDGGVAHVSTTVVDTPGGASR